MPISRATRQAILDELSLSGISWSGRLEEPDFLARIYPMREMPSHDHRYRSAYRDVQQHRVYNTDWQDDWVFTDARFQLVDGPDQVFLRFLAETVHPVVREDVGTAARLVAGYNEHLRLDGYELHETGQIAGRPVFGARSLVESSRSISQLRAASPLVDAAYISQQITRMEAAVTSDPDLAIGTAKELLETVAKTILDEAGIEYQSSEGLTRLVAEARDALNLVPEDVDSQSTTGNALRRLLGSLGGIAGALVELRNSAGTGHGRTAHAGMLDARHARLAAGASATLATFLFESYHSTLRGEAET